jgi:hypothetical protein
MRSRVLAFFKSDRCTWCPRPDNAPDHENFDVSLRRRTVALRVVALSLLLAVAACEDTGPSPSVAPPSPGASTTAFDFSAIGCATEDPEDVGELTGAWQGDDGGVYYIRQVGDCVWWFGTEVDDVQSGRLGQPGFANVATGRVDGALIEVEWADLPLGDILGGGGLTLVYDVANDRLLITEQRGDWLPYGASMLTRIHPEASPEGSPSGSASP